MALGIWCSIVILVSAIFASWILHFIEPHVWRMVLLWKFYQKLGTLLCMWSFGALARFGWKNFCSLHIGLSFGSSLGRGNHLVALAIMASLLASALLTRNWFHHHCHGPWSQCPALFLSTPNEQPCSVHLATHRPQNRAFDTLVYHKHDGSFCCVLIALPCL